MFFDERELQLLLTALIFTASPDACLENSEDHSEELYKLAKKFEGINALKDLYFLKGQEYEWDKTAELQERFKVRLHDVSE